MDKNMVKMVKQQSGLDLPLWQVENLLSTFCRVIKTETVKTGLLRLRGFGVFRVAERPGRMLKNSFGKGQEKELPPYKVVRFSPGQSFKAMVRQ